MSTGTTPASATGDSALPVAALRDKCEPIERDLLFRKRVVAGALDGVRPGGAENVGTDAGAWLSYLLHLTRLHAREGADPSSSRGSDNKAELEEALVKALSAEGEGVSFDDGVRRVVHPKSYYALRFLDQLDAIIRLETKELALSAERSTTDAVVLHVRGHALESKAVCVWLWVLTHPGAGLPFDERSPDPHPPKWTRSATVTDIMRVAQAHLQIHAERLAVISQAFPPDPANGTSRLPLAGFIGAMAHEGTERAESLMRQWTLGEIFAQSVSASRAARESEDRAKAKHDRES